VSPARYGRRSQSRARYMARILPTSHAESVGIPTRISIGRICPRLKIVPYEEGVKLVIVRIRIVAGSTETLFCQILPLGPTTMLHTIPLD